MQGQWRDINLRLISG